MAFDSLQSLRRASLRSRYDQENNDFIAPRLARSSVRVSDRCVLRVIAGESSPLDSITSDDPLRLSVANRKKKRSVHAGGYRAW